MEETGSVLAAGCVILGQCVLIHELRTIDAGYPWLSKCFDCRWRSYVKAGSLLRSDDCRGCLNMDCWACRGPRFIKGALRSLEHARSMDPWNESWTPEGWIAWLAWWLDSQWYRGLDGHYAEKKQKHTLKETHYNNTVAIQGTGHETLTWQNTRNRRKKGQGC